MAITLDRQARFVTDDETDVDSALTVRGVRELAWSMNNYKAYVSAPVLVSQTSPLFHVGEFDTHLHALFAHEAAVTTETLIHRFAPRFAPHGYTKIWTQAAGWNSDAAAYCTWRLYASTQPYTGPVVFNAGYLGASYSESAGHLVSGTHAVSAGNVTTMSMVRTGAGTIFLTLTAQKDDADEDAYLSSILAVARP